MRHAAVALAVLGLLLLVWWGRGEESARSAPPLAPLEEPAPPDPPPPEEEPEPAPETPSIPPDPAGLGDCALFVSIVDAETRRPFASAVELWRLDAPGNEAWTEGDQLQATLDVPVDGAEICGLPDGVYRPVCLGARNTAADPEPVRVEGERTEVTLEVPVPRTFHAYVRVFDADGRPVQRVSVGRSRSWRDRGDPEWRKPRLIRDGKGGAYPWLGSGGGGAGGTGGRHIHTTQPREGFRIGPFTEDTRRAVTTHRVTIGVDGCNAVQVVIPGTAADDLTFAGLAVPIAPIRDRLRMPDGRTLAEANGQIVVSYTAVAVEPSAPAPLLSVQPFRVQVTVPGFKDATFEHRLGAPLPSLAFEPQPREGKD